MALLRTQQRSHRYFQRLDSDEFDVDPSATSMTGMAAQVALQRRAGRHWRGGIGASTISPGFEMNDMGYQRRGDRVDVNANLTYVENTPGPVFRYWEVSAQEVLEHSYSGYMVQNALFASAFAQTRNYWALQLGASRSAEATDDRLTRGGVLARRPPQWSTDLYVASDGRKPLVGSFGARYHDEGASGWQGRGQMALLLRTSPRWNLSVGPTWSRYVTAAQFLGAAADPAAVDTRGVRFFFADLDQTTVTLDTRFNYTFNPRLSFEAFLQPFVSTVDFGDTRTLAEARSFRFDPSTQAAPGDFTFRSLRGNALLRWEWRRGSTLFVAWQQTREGFQADYARLDLGHERAELFRNRPDNVFVIKINYWLNP
jgi:hypothetical protein